MRCVCGDVTSSTSRYSGNAVVISSVVLLSLFFVVGLTLSRYWDVVQRRRHSSVPLCGLDGPFRYQLLVVTGKLPGAGQSFRVFDSQLRCAFHELLFVRSFFQFTLITGPPNHHHHHCRLVEDRRV